MWCWASSIEWSRESRHSIRLFVNGNRVFMSDDQRLWRVGSWFRRPLAPWPDVVSLDHFVQRGRLDVKQLSGTLLHAAGRFQRGLDQLLLEIGDHVFERDAFGR